MTTGFVKLHRQIKGHWVTTRPEWFQAWMYILMSTNYETGRVNLTEVYRELLGLFDNRAWRYLVEKLQKDGMLSDLEGRNLGSKAGYQQTANVANWSKYHEKTRGAAGGANVPDHAEQPRVTDEENTEPARSQRGASAEHYAESNKNTFKEVKEVQERGGDGYVSSEASAFAEMQGKPNPRTQEIQNQNHLRRLVGGENFKHPQIRDSWHSWYIVLSAEEIEAIWKEARGQSDVSPLFWFIDVCNGKRTRPKSAEDSASPKVRFGDVVFHPEQGEFVADFEALYEDAWRCPEGYFIPSRELQVVRSTDA